MEFDAGILLGNLVIGGLALFAGAVAVFGGIALVVAVKDQVGMLGVLLMLVGVIIGGGLLLGYILDLTGPRESAGLFDLLLSLGKQKITIANPFE